MGEDQQARTDHHQRGRLALAVDDAAEDRGEEEGAEGDQAGHLGAVVQPGVDGGHEARPAEVGQNPAEAEFVHQQIGCILNKGKHRRVEGDAEQGDVDERGVAEQLSKV